MQLHAEYQSDTLIADVPNAYWTKDYYKEIPKLSMLPATDTANFTKVVQKYSGSDFNYLENKLEISSFWERILLRIIFLLAEYMPIFKPGEISDSTINVLKVMALAVVLFLVYKLIFNGRKFWVKTEKADEELTEIAFIEKNLLEIDLDPYITQATQSGNYPLAIRYLNLQNIQLLAKKGLLQWKPSKSNAELLADIKDPLLKTDFERCISLFNRVWFSNELIAADEYLKYVAIFQQFQSAWR